MAIGVGVETGDGRYILLEAIGQGGMGDLYKAQDRQLDRTVAIKAIRSDITERPDVEKRLAREARLAASLDHPFICKIHELLRHDDGQTLLVMEYVDGRTLKELLRDGPLDPARVVRLAREMAEAFSVAHQRGLIHRDIKPSNVMVTSHGHVKVMDFGIAKMLSDPNAATTSTLTEPGHVVGTPAYMSPEHAAGRAVDGRADIYSFGVLLFQCLTGTLPPASDASMPDPEGQLAAAIRTLPSGVPGELRTIVVRCLQRKPEARFDSFDAIRAALDTSTLLRLSVTSTDARPWIDRRTGSSRYWLVAATLLAIAIAIGGFGYWRATRTTPAPVLAQEPVVTWPTTEEGGRVSADGAKVTFVSSQRGQSRLWIRTVDGSEPVAIGKPRDALKTPVWSPDGQQIAYLFPSAGQAWLQIVAVWGEAKSGPSSLGSGWDDVALVRWIGTHVYFSVSAGSTSSVLCMFDTHDRSTRQITRQADGKRFTATGRLANIDVRRDEARVVFEATSPDIGLWIADLDGRNAESLNAESKVVISPRWRGGDGTRVLFVSNANGQHDIWEYNIKTRQSAALTTSPLEETSVDASAAGDVVVADTVEEGSHLWAVNPERPGAAQQVTNDGRSDVWPSAALHSERLVFNRRKGAFVGYTPIDTDVQVARWKGGELVEQRTATAGASGVMSPDGRRVLFVRFRDDSVRYPELWVYDVDAAREAVRLSEGLSFPATDIATWDALGQTAAWAPAGAETLFFARRAEAGASGFELVQATLDAGLRASVRVLATEAPRERPGIARRFLDLAVSEDGHAIAYALADRLPYRGGQLMWLDLTRTNAAPQKLFEAGLGTGIWVAGWTRRNTVVAVVSSGPGSGSTSRILEIDRDGRQRLVASVPGLLGFTARIDPVRNRLFATVMDDGAATVCAVSIADGKRLTVVPNSVDGITFGGYAVMLDGWLVYTRKETNRNVWLFDFREGKRRDASRGGG